MSRFPVRGRTPLVLTGVVALLCAAPSYAHDPVSALSVRITSPLGRTGFDGPIRIVAQVQRPDEVHLAAVKFFVDQQIVGTAKTGPPYAIEWTDQNPYEPREIVAEVCSDAGACVRDTVRLPPLEINEVSEVASVLIEAAVQDRSGRYIGGLTLADFMLRENDAEQVIDLVRSETVDSTYTLLIDCSQSMANRIEFVQQAAARLVKFLRPEDKIIVAPFTKTFGSITGPTGDRGTILSAIAATRPGGGTAVLDTITRLPELLNGVTGRQAVILLTDGYDEHSTALVDDAVRAAKAAQATIFVIGIGGTAGISIKGERALRALAESSGGRAFFPTRDEEVPRIHELIAADVQQRYLLAYTPNNEKRDGTWRAVTLTTADPTYKVRARPGYFASAPPPVRATLEFVVAGPPGDDDVELSGADLQLVEDGVTQALDTFHEAVAPLSIVLAIDASGSMKPAAEAVKDAAKRFVGALRPNDELALLLFADEAVTVHDLTKDRQGIVKAIDEYQATGGTALNDAVVAALTRLGGVDRRRAIVVLTDGRDENNPGTGPGSRHSVSEVLDRIRAVDAAIYSIGLGPRVDRATLAQLAAASGGEAFFPESTEALPGEYQRVVERLRRRYVASYVSSNPLRDGQWRQVSITSGLPGVEIVSRGGYFAPKD